MYTGSSRLKSFSSFPLSLPLPLFSTPNLPLVESFLASEAGLAEEEVVKEDKGKQRADEGSIDNPVVLDNVPSTSTRSFSGGKRKVSIPGPWRALYDELPLSHHP